jgi:hypothetical protein
MLEQQEDSFSGFGEAKLCTYWVRKLSLGTRKKRWCAVRTYFTLL